MTPKTSTALLGVAVGLVVGIAGTSLHLQQQEPGHPLAEITTLPVPTAVPTTPATTESPVSTPTEWDAFRVTDGSVLLQTAFYTLAALESKDYQAFSTLVHTEKGVRFTPYSTVNLETDLVFSAQDLKSLAQDTTAHSWGVDVRTGDPISLTYGDYFAKYVTPLNYSNAPNIATDVVILRGNALENVIESYPDCRFVDFSFPMVDPESKGTDWSSLKLVFESVDNAWYLVGIVHSQWTS